MRDITRLAFRQDKELQACIETLIKVYCMRIDGLLSISYWVRDKLYLMSIHECSSGYFTSAGGGEG